MPILSNSFSRALGLKNTTAPTTQRAQKPIRRSSIDPDFASAAQDLNLPSSEEEDTVLILSEDDAPRHGDAMEDPNYAPLGVVPHFPWGESASSSSSRRGSSSSSSHESGTESLLAETPLAIVRQSLPSSPHLQHQVQRLQTLLAELNPELVAVHPAVTSLMAASAHALQRYGVPAVRSLCAVLGNTVAELPVLVGNVAELASIIAGATGVVVGEFPWGSARVAGREIGETARAWVERAREALGEHTARIVEAMRVDADDGGYDEFIEIDAEGVAYKIAEDARSCGREDDDTNASNGSQTPSLGRLDVVFQPSIGFEHQALHGSERLIFEEAFVARAEAAARERFAQDTQAANTREDSRQIWNHESAASRDAGPCESLPGAATGGGSGFEDVDLGDNDQELPDDFELL